MAINQITTGEQAVSATGAITGTLDTSAMSGDYSIKLRVRGLAAAKQMIVALEDTANASAFSEAINVHTFPHFAGAIGDDGVTVEVHSRQLKQARFGATNTKYRFNVLSIDASPGSGLKAIGWLEQ